MKHGCKWLIDKILRCQHLLQQQPIINYILIRFSTRSKRKPRRQARFFYFSKLERKPFPQKGGKQKAKCSEDFLNFYGLVAILRSDRLVHFLYSSAAYPSSLMEFF